MKLGNPTRKRGISPSLTFRVNSIPLDFFTDSNTKTRNMTIKTKKVQGRRQLRYADYDAFLTDAEATAADSANVKNLGNWSIGQVFQHLAKSLLTSVEGADFKAPLPIRVIAKLFFKKKFIYKALPAGFPIPDHAAKIFLPADQVAADSGIAELRSAIERVKSDKTRAEHGLFGKLTNEEWDNFNLRHAELHMSFLVPPGA
jgi:hypothetical protein